MLGGDLQISSFLGLKRLLGRENGLCETGGCP